MSSTPSKYVHLHVHSHYSLLNAVPQLPDLVAEAKKQEMTALALTDNGNMYGAIEFYKECKGKGIKPIIGVDCYVAARTRQDKQAGVDSRRTRLVLLAKDIVGYKNLIKLVSASYLEGFYYKPRIDKELMAMYSSNLICIIPSFSGTTTNHLRTGDVAAAKETLAEIKAIYGDENTFLEISHHPEIDGHMKIMEDVQKLAKETNTPLVAQHDVYYLKPDDRRARETLMSIMSTGGEKDRSSLNDEEEEDFSFKNGAEMEKFFKKIPEAIENSAKIADMCNLDLPLGQWVFPNYIVPSGLSYNDELRRLVYEGIEKRGLQKTDEIVQRAEYELNIIFTKGYSPYFLVVSDLLHFAHENNILTTIRGSVAGSLVTYLAGITNVNPLVYKLPFERFLNPERPSAPDIDMDYADNRRDEMIDYARRKYGHDKVAQIGTFGTMMARGSVRDTARALGYPYSIGDQISKMIPMGSQGFPMTIETALDTVPELKKQYKEDAQTKEIIDMAMKIEGCARHISVHAAGVVISPTPLTDFTPLQYDTKGDNKIISQYDMRSVEEAGLLKFDFLGIRNLSILADAVRNVETFYGTKVDIENIPLDDKKTFSMLAKGETIGLFQLNGAGMTRYLMELKPTSIFDINAMVALYRPGPMESIPEYVKRKHNPELVTYIDPRLKEILSQSYGVITYQDDVLLTAIHLAGYSWLDADKLRKAMGKKVPEVMEAEKSKLLAGFVKNGLSEAKAQELWKLIEPFAAYGFNKAHAASYGRVAYQTAYMKANFPAVYMASVLTAESGDIEKIAEIITECKRMQIPVLPPDVNESYTGFTVITDAADGKEKIRFGLTTIKNFGEGVAQAIIIERKVGGKFTSIANFLERIKDRALNRKSLESLIKCGAMDAFGERGCLLSNIEGLLAHNKEKTKASSSQDSLFGAHSIELPGLKLHEAPSATMDDKLAWEKELLGLYISGHPLEKFRAQLEAHDVNIKKIRAEFRDGMGVVLAGIIDETKELLTKKGDRMMFMKITDLTGSLETVVFPKIYEEFKAILMPDKCIAVRGKYSTRNGTPSLIVDKIKTL